MAKKTIQFDPDIKVGIETGIIEDTTKRVIFSSPFEHVPTVFLTVSDNIQRPCHVQVENLALTEFYIRIIQLDKGDPAIRTVAWMATDYALD